VSDCHCPDNRRPSWDPVVLFKVVFLQFLYDLSDRQIEGQVNLNHQKLKQRGQRSSIIIKKNRTDADIIGQADPTSQRERPSIERKFAEQKKYHGLRRARYWGLVKVTVQVLLTCLVVNCKRMVRLREARCAPPKPALCLANSVPPIGLVCCM